MILPIDSLVEQIHFVLTFLYCAPNCSPSPSDRGIEGRSSCNSLVTTTLIQSLSSYSPHDGEQRHKYIWRPFLSTTRSACYKQTCLGPSPTSGFPLFPRSEAIRSGRLLSPLKIKNPCDLIGKDGQRYLCWLEDQVSRAFRCPDAHKPFACCITVPSKPRK